MSYEIAQMWSEIDPEIFYLQAHEDENNSLPWYLLHDGSASLREEQA
jgi:hypothetical protein